MEDMIINHWAVIVAALANLVVGALWYSPALFYKAWKSENQLTDDQLKTVNPVKLHGISTLLSLIICYNLAFFLGDAKTDWVWGTTAGFLAGFGWAAIIFAIIAMYEFKSWRYILINGGYITVYFTLIGFILGIWR
ncbi:DUF1761 domain-containing protein [Marinoscillum sp. 108]|uniref:DUF1761 domain-containing protein n=1 Tax=Marinoscillum sp. 108 TaxID=2653151 RepID=UPI0012F0186C|nr:DUF1761 domain-containing protein [Marinoscillum sp. 108]VXD16515.1 conserved membrane hypothetical protein [Marinoscillum sp. 108]